MKIRLPVIGWMASLARLVRGPRERPALDYLLGEINPQAPLAQRVAWLIDVIRWVKVHQPPKTVVAGEGVAEGDDAPAEMLATDTLRLRAARVRFVLRVLDRQPAWKSAFAKTLRSVLRDAQAVRLFGATGLPQEFAFWSEAVHRVAAKFLPEPPVDDDLAQIFLALFPEHDDAVLLERLPHATLAAFRALFHYDEAPEEACWAVLRRDLDDAVVALGARIAAVGVVDAIRRRAVPGALQSSPFLRVGPAAEAVIATGDGSVSAAEAAVTINRYHQERDGCRRALAEVTAHLEENGVSVALVYQVELALWRLDRIDRLVLLATDAEHSIGAYARFVAQLVREMHARRSVRALFRTNLTLLTRKIAERTGKTGEHYITHDRAEYGDMLRSSAKGGALTGITVFVKFLTVGHGLAPFFEGVAAALNYAVSFCLIQFTHGTLATKQPAMTAAALAGKLKHARHRGRLREFVDEVANLTRSQVAAIFGNLAIVIPAALVVGVSWALAGGDTVPGTTKALATIESLSILGATPVYAAFTGVLLWTSAVLSGWVENWATFRRLPDAIARHPRLVYAFGPERMRRTADWFDRNVAGLGGNISLGVLLGMIPVVAAFFGLPLDVRHVTLSTGSLALAVYALGSATLLSTGFWLAVAGIAVIGALNLGVSFALALWVAIRSTGARELSRRRVYRAVIARFFASPRDFLLPPRGKS